MKTQNCPLLLAVALLFCMTAALAQVNVTLPSTTQTSTLSATIPEQVTVTVPATISFGNVSINATNQSVATTTAAQTVTLTGIVLVTGNNVSIGLEANAANFTPPTGGPSFAAADVSWNAATWSLGTGTAGTLSSTAVGVVGASSANPAGTVQTTNLTFTLGVHSFGATAVLSGAQTLVATWHITSV